MGNLFLNLKILEKTDSLVANKNMFVVFSSHRNRDQNADIIEVINMMSLCCLSDVTVMAQIYSHHHLASTFNDGTNLNDIDCESRRAFEGQHECKNLTFI